MSTSTIEALRQRHRERAGKEQPKSTSDETRYNLKEGKNTLRIIPGKTEGDLPFYEFAIHRLDSFDTKENKVVSNSYICLKETPAMKDRCPICEGVAKLWRDGKKDEWKTYKRYPKYSEYAYSNVLDHNGTELLPGVKIIRFTKAQFDQLLALYDNPQWGDITDWKTGVILDILMVKKTGQNFAEATISPWRNSTELDKKALVDKLINLEEQVLRWNKRLTVPELVEAWIQHRKYVENPIIPATNSNIKEETKQETKEVIQDTKESNFVADLKNVVEEVSSLSGPQTAPVSSDLPQGFRVVPERPEGSPVCFGQTKDQNGAWIGWNMTDPKCMVCPLETVCEETGNKFEAGNKKA